MIKRIVFGVSSAPPADPRVLRATLSIPIGETAGEPGYLSQWFADGGALAAYEASETDKPDPADVVLVEEVPQRGADWLAQRWVDGGCRYKHVAMAKRAVGTTLAEMSEGWRGHAGRTATKTSTAAVAIPDEAKGLAYIQNHPLPRGSGEWRHDAITEVWFDAPAGMTARIDLFRNVAPGALFSEASFLAVREEMI